jgi:hypothetical protein
MARPRTLKSIPKSVVIPGQPKIYAEGKHDYAYLTGLAQSYVILNYLKGTQLPATEVKQRIEAIEKDLNNDAIECVIWIVDGGDQHIKKSKHFTDFYKKWQGKKDGEWKKLHVLINAPCLEYWFLLHRTKPPLLNNGSPICFENADALLNSAEFKKHCAEGKGANLVNAIVRDAVGRKQAIKRAEGLSAQLNDLPDKKLLKIARAEMYRIFELIKVENPNYSSLKVVE